MFKANQQACFPPNLILAVPLSPSHKTIVIFSIDVKLTAINNINTPTHSALEVDASARGPGLPSVDKPAWLQKIKMSKFQRRTCTSFQIVIFILHVG